jgi:hypothetical protein
MVANMATQTLQNPAGITPAIPALRAAGLGDTKSREVVRSGLIPTFRIGRVLYATLADLASLPGKFAEPTANAKLVSARYPRRRNDQIDDAVASRVARIAGQVREGGGTQ